MAIFKKGVSHDYDVNMNIFFCDANGKLKSDANMQKINDFRMLGISYLQNAEVVLAHLLGQDPRNGDGESMILPVLFNTWHGLELLLKCGNMICDEYLGIQNQKYSKHTIDVYADQFLEKMKRLGFKNLEKEEFVGVAEFVDDCKENNAHFDFARYTMQSNGQSQFYNTPDSNGVVPVVSLDMIEFAQVLMKINYNFVDVIDFLFDMLNRYGKGEQKVINESALKMYIEHEGCSRFVGDYDFENLEERAQKAKNNINCQIFDK